MHTSEPVHTSEPLNNASLNAITATIFGLPIHRGGEPEAGDRQIPHFVLYKGEILKGKPTSIGPSYDKWSPSTNLIDAFEIVNEMLKKGFCYKICGSDKDHHVEFWKHGSRSSKSGSSETWEIAICLAAINAVSARTSEDVRANLPMRITEGVRAPTPREPAPQNVLINEATQIPQKKKPE